MFWNKLFGRRHRAVRGLSYRQARKHFLKRVATARIYDYKSIKDNYGYCSLDGDSRHAGPIIEHKGGKLDELDRWIGETLKKGGRDAKDYFADAVSKNHINFSADRAGQICFTGSFTKDYHIYVVKWASDAYEWVLWKFVTEHLD